MARLPMFTSFNSGLGARRQTRKVRPLSTHLPELTLGRHDELVIEWLGMAMIGMGEPEQTAFWRFRHFYRISLDGRELDDRDLADRTFPKKEICRPARSNE